MTPEAWDLLIETVADRAVHLHLFKTAPANVRVKAAKRALLASANQAGVEGVQFKDIEPKVFETIEAIGGDEKTFKECMLRIPAEYKMIIEDCLEAVGGIDE